MKKLFVLTICAGMTAAMMACGNNAAKTEDPWTAVTESTEEEPLIGGDPSTWGPAEDTDEGENTQIPNPFVVCDTFEEAGKLAGFDFTAPATADGYQFREISAIEKEMAQITYFNSDELDGLTDEELNEIDWEKVDFSGHDLTIRKAPGEEDISGVYTEYPEMYQITVDGKEVTIKGEDGKVNVATWKADGYSYAVIASDGLTSDAAINLIENTK